MSANAATAMLPELAERDATGDIARIYREIRETCAVPYVSSLQRHLATRPGWLEWSWAAVRPAFISGAAQTAAWNAAAKVDAIPLPPLSPAALRSFGVDAGDVRTIHAICETFVRVSPTNLMLSGLLRRLLDGRRRTTVPGCGTPTWTPPWAPPAPLPTLPPLADPAALGADARAVLFTFATEVDGSPFVPGLYRMLAHWPAYLAHLATVLAPRFDDPASRSSCADVLRCIDDVVPAVFATLPPLADAPPEPPRSEFAGVRAAL
ncbi:MAG: hypothetical protein KKB37_08205, partial [Alphaproteobacteria bacterium]|nr:hypothetical protein [Alphaproteobacteria bacterium]